MSKVFSPHRVQGLVSGDVEAVVQTRGTQHFVTTCLQKSFHTYNCEKLTLQFVSPLHESHITCLTSHKDLILTAADSVIRSWSRGKLVKCYLGHSGVVSHLLPFGDKIISFGADKKMIVHDIETGEVYGEVYLQSCTTAVTHPATYINKILIGDKDGNLELWNVRNLKLIHRFKLFDSHITVLAQSPGLDIIGVGLKNGKILLHNIKLDQTLLKFYQDWGCVTSLSFRSDGVAHMVSGSVEGHLAVWDLDKGELHSTVHSAHSSTVHTTHYLASQPLLLTASQDNSVKIWIFDGPGGTCRLLKERSGHRAPPTIARCYSGDRVLTAGRDRSLRLFSVIKDERSRELSQGSLESKSKKINVNVDDLKLTPVTALAAEEIREREWSNVLTAHSGSRDVRMWSTLNHSLATKPLSPKLETIVVTAVAITVCGNIGLVGYNSGHLTAFNLQSGINRGLYGKTYAHRGKITGVCADNINKFVISTGQDMTVKIWDLSERSLVTSISLAHPITQCNLHRDSNLLACALDTSWTVCLVDIDTHKTVREFRHSALLLDMCFSLDGKFLLVASNDHVIRMWDLVTARLVDCFKTHNLVTSVSLSKEHLVTTSSNELGICIWTNTTLYEDVELKPLSDDYEPRFVEMGKTSEEMDTSFTEDDGEEWQSPDQINESLITFSSTPKAKWTTLYNLDAIKQRNKPKAPPTAPKAAPFFMTTTKELVPKFVVEDMGESKEEDLKPTRNEESDFQRVILSTVDPKETLRYLDTLAPSALDIELQSLAPLDGGSHELVTCFLDFLIAAVAAKCEFDMVQAYINVFLKHNREYLMKTAEVHDKLAELKTLHFSSWTELQQKIQECLCVTNFLKNATL